MVVVVVACCSYVNPPQNDIIGLLCFLTMTKVRVVSGSGRRLAFALERLN